MAAPQGWSKLYNDLPDHPKFVRAGYQAGWLYICGQCYCSQNLTDGRIPKGIVLRLSALPRPMVYVRRLVENGLWHDCGDYYEQHDYCEMQRTAAQVDRERDVNRERQQRGRMSRRDTTVTGGVCHGVTHGDVTFTESESDTVQHPPPAVEVPLENAEPPPDWHQEPFGNKVNDLWRRLQLETPRGYDWLQGAVKVSSLRKDWEEAEILAVCTKISQTPALAWAGTKGPAYLAAPCGKAKISVMETCHRWRDDEAQAEDAAPVVSYDGFARVAKTKAQLDNTLHRDNGQPAKAKPAGPSAIGDLLPGATP